MTELPVETAAPVKDRSFVCDQCGLTKSPEPNSISTGYGVDKDGRKICFDCCGANDHKALAEAKPGDKFVHYLKKEYTGDQWTAKVQHDKGTMKLQVTAKNEEQVYTQIMAAEGCPRRAITIVGRPSYRWHVINWPGTMKIPCYYSRNGRGGFGSTRHDVWFKYEGKHFWGWNAGASEILHIKCLKK